MLGEKFLTFALFFKEKYNFNSIYRSSLFLCLYFIVTKFPLKLEFEALTFEQS